MNIEENGYEIPAVALRGMTILPDMIIHFDLSRKRSIQAVEQAMNTDQRLLVVTQKDPGTEEPECKDLYEVGTVVNIRQITRLPNDIIRVLAEGRVRAKLLSFSEEVSEYLLARIEEAPRGEKLSEYEEEAGLRELRSIFERYCQFYPKVGKNLTPRVQEAASLEYLIDEITSNIPLHYENKQSVLGELDLRERFTLLCQILLNEVEVARVRMDLSDIVEEPAYPDAMLLCSELLKAYAKGEIGEIYLAYTAFRNTVSHVPTLLKLLPVEHVAESGGEEPEVPMNFEADDEEALEMIIPKYVASLIYGGLMEAVASENGARMQAMDNATSNAEEMISDLTLKYNRARQGSITQELTEIIAGAEAIS